MSVAGSSCTGEIINHFAKPLTSDRLEKALSNSPKKRRGKVKDRMFLRGPIPVSWLERAARLPGKCLHLGNVLWLLSGLNQTRTFRLEHQWCTRFGIGRGATGRCLQELERSGLISVDRRSGRSPVVTILACECLA